MIIRRAMRRVGRLLRGGRTPGIHLAHEIVDPSDPRAESLLKEVSALDPWFYPVRIGPVGVAPGIGTNQPTQRLSDRTLFREHLLIEPLVRSHCMKGKSVLEIACNMGYWSSRLVAWGAERMVGIEGRRAFIRQGELFYSTNRILPDGQWKFIEGNVLDKEIWSTVQSMGPFDVSLCTGILYHLPDYREILKWLHEVTREALVVDTRVRDLPEQLVDEPGDLKFNAIEATRRKIIPCRSSLLDWLDRVGFDCDVISPRYLTPTTLADDDDYDLARRITVLARKR